MFILQSKDNKQNAASHAMTMRKCWRCEQVKPIDAFGIIRGTQNIYSGFCSACFEARQAKIKEQQRKCAPRYRQALRVRVINAYGGACACCGETEPKFLAIDHINNDGAKHRRELQLKGGGSFYAWIIKNDFPKTLQLLCHNCNLAKGFYGECPHVRAKSQAA